MKSLIMSSWFWGAVSALVALMLLARVLWISRNALTVKVGDFANCKKDEENFRKRIGKQVDEHETRLDKGDDRFVKIEKCLIFLVENAEPGAAARMGLYH
jgi:hypothetical protein